MGRHARPPGGLVSGRRQRQDAARRRGAGCLASPGRDHRGRLLGGSDRRGAVGCPGPRGRGLRPVGPARAGRPRADAADEPSGLRMLPLADCGHAGMTTAIAVYGSDGCEGRCDAKCHTATSAECDCVCGGRLHGVGSSQAAITKNTEDAFGSVEAAKAWAAAHEVGS